MMRYQVLSARGVYDHELHVPIPPNKSNESWLAYLRWLKAGNIPSPPTPETDLLTKAKRNLP